MRLRRVKNKALRSGPTPLCLQSGSSKRLTQQQIMRWQTPWEWHGATRKNRAQQTTSKDSTARYRTLGGTILVENSGCSKILESPDRTRYGRPSWSIGG